MSKPLLKAVCVVSLASVSISTSASAAPVHCFLEVNNHVYVNGICNFEPGGGGSFSIGTGDKARSRYFAYVNIDANEGVARGYWNGEEGESHAHWELGTLVRQGACWVNDHAKVCAKR